MTNNTLTIIQAIEIENDLKQFTGTEQYHRHFMGGLFTDGVDYMAENFGAYWLLDIIFSYQRKEPFQVWELKVENDKGTVTMVEDTDCPILVRQEIPFTDFPLPYFKLWLCDGVLLLPSEY